MWDPNKKFSFLEAYDELEELWTGNLLRADSEVDKDILGGLDREALYYHFYRGLSDLISSLASGTIAANKNTAGSQYDIYADYNQSYVCMTKGRDGKQRTAVRLCGPYGISFKDLVEFTRAHKYYTLGTNGYNQVLAKTVAANGGVDFLRSIQKNRPFKFKSIDRIAGRNESSTINLPYYNSRGQTGRIKEIAGKVDIFKDFSLLSIAKIKVRNNATGEIEIKCFVTGGSGRNLTTQFSSRLFDYEEGGLYDKLHSLYDSCMKSDRGFMVYQFLNNTLGNPTASVIARAGKTVTTYKTIMRDGNCNSKYQPRADSDKKSTKDPAKTPDQDENAATSNSSAQGDATDNMTANSSNTAGDKAKRSKKQSANEVKTLVDPNTWEWVEGHGRIITGPTFSASMCFDLEIPPSKGEYTFVSFDELIGVGPLCAKDAEDNVIIRMTYVNPGTKGGYTAPAIISFSGYEGESGIILGTPSTVRGNFDLATGNIHKTGGKVTPKLLASPELAKQFSALFDESEYRVYIDGKRDFRFSANDLCTIILPKNFTIPGKDSAIVHLDVLGKYLASNDGIIAPKTEAEVFPFLANIGAVNNPAGKLGITSQIALKWLIQLLVGKYKDVGLEFVDNKLDSSSYDQGFTQVDEDDLKNVKIGGVLPKYGYKYRWLVDVAQVRPDLDSLTFKDWHHAGDTCIALIYGDNIERRIDKRHKPVMSKITGEQEYATARLGAEAIILGKDSNSDYYVLFVDNAYKASGFLELPGGGLPASTTKANYDQACLSLIQQRLRQKAGLRPSDYSKLNTKINGSEKALLLNEVCVAQDEAADWTFAYYRLYTGYYIKELIDADELDYQFDSTTLDANERFTDDPGYNSHLKWVRADLLEVDPRVASRYISIIPVVKDLIANAGNNLPAVEPKPVEVSEPIVQEVVELSAEEPEVVDEPVVDEPQPEDEEVQESFRYYKDAFDLDF